MLACTMPLRRGFGSRLLLLVVDERFMHALICFVVVSARLFVQAASEPADRRSLLHGLPEARVARASFGALAQRVAEPASPPTLRARAAALPTALLAVAACPLALLATPRYCPGLKFGTFSERIWKHGSARGHVAVGAAKRRRLLPALLSGTASAPCHCFRGRGRGGAPRMGDAENGAEDAVVALSWRQGSRPEPVVPEVSIALNSIGVGIRRERKGIFLLISMLVLIQNNRQAYVY